MTLQTSPVRRRPLTAIDVRSPEAARMLGRVLPAAGNRELRAATFNSAL